MNQANQKNTPQSHITLNKNALPELLAPAGNLEKFRTAILYGANAVYLGGKDFNLRASSEGLDASELKIAVQEANASAAKIYYCLNAMPMERHLKAMPQSIEAAAEAGVHGFIAADPGVIRLVKQYAPQVEIHLSTQTNTTNSQSIHFWQEQGISRVNLARELSCVDISALRKACPTMALEVFVHGAMCLAVSGQCLLSAWLNKRPANLGRCTHPCRFEYKALGANKKTCHSCNPEQYTELELSVAEKTRPDAAVWHIDQTDEYARFWAPQDLCLLPYLPWFVRTGINSIKIEGRMKSSSYVAHVVDAYRTSLDSLKNLQTMAEARSFDPQNALNELLNTATRELGSGFFIPNNRISFTPDHVDPKTFDTPRLSPQALLARVIDPNKELGSVALQNQQKNSWAIEVRGAWRSDMAVELMLPGMRRVVLPPNSYSLENHKGQASSVVNSGMRATLKSEHPELMAGIFIRALAK